MIKNILFILLLLTISCKKSDSNSDKITGSYTCYEGDGITNYTFTDDTLKTENAYRNDTYKLNYPSPNTFTAEGLGNFTIERDIKNKTDYTDPKIIFVLIPTDPNSTPIDRVACFNLLSKEEFKKQHEANEKSLRDGS